MTHIINWRGLHGYGDWVPPARLAHNDSVRRDEDIHVVFHITNRDRKFKPGDASSKEDMIRFIFDNTDKTDVTRNITWEARYNVHPHLIPEPQDSNALDNLYGDHNFRLSNEKWRWDGGNPDTVAVVSTASHKEKFRDIIYRGEKEPGSKSWKDPWPDRWDEFVDRFELYGIKVNHIHYSDPVEEVARKIKESSIVYGYQAGATWMANWQGAPMVVCTEKKMWSEELHPWCVHYSSKDFDTIHYNMFEDIEKSLELREKYIDRVSALWRESRVGNFVWQGQCGRYPKRHFPYKSHSSEKRYLPHKAQEQREIEEFLRAKRK